MKKSTKKILSITSACAFVFALGLGLFAFNNSGNSYKAGNNAKDEVKAAQADEHAQQAEAQNNEAGKVAYVEGAKITGKTDLSTIPAPKEGESHIKKGETPEDNVFYVGPDAGDTYKDDANQANLAASNDEEGTQCVYWGIKDGTLIIRNTPNDDASNYNDQSGANADNPPAWHGFYKEIVAVDIQEAVKAPSYKSWFSPAEKSGWAHSPRIKYINGFKNLDLSGATNTSYMFCGLNYDPDFAMTLIPSWGEGNTLNLSKVVNAAGMFACTGDASGKGTAFNCAFNTKTETVNIVSDGGLQQTQAMFQGAVMNPEKENLTMNLSNMDMSNVTNAGYMLHNSRNIKTVILGKVDGSKLVRARSMFNNMKQTTKIDMSQWSKDLPNTADANFDYIGVFQNDTALQEIHTVENLDWATTFKKEVPDKSSYMFYGDASLVGSDGTQCSGTDTTVDKANADLAKHITKFNGSDASYESLGAGYFTVTTPKAYETVTENGSTLNFVYDSVHRPDASIYSVYAAEKVTDHTSDASHQALDIPWEPIKNNFTTAAFADSFKNYQPKQIAWWFDKFSKLETITGMENFDFSQVGIDVNKTQGFRGAFNECAKLTTAKVTGGQDGIFDFSNFSIGGDNYHINTCKYMFGACTNLEKIMLPDAENINTSSVTDFCSMFRNANKLSKIASKDKFNDASDGTLDISCFNTENAKDFSEVFLVNNLGDTVATKIIGPGTKEHPTKFSDQGCTLKNFAAYVNSTTTKTNKMLEYIDFYYCDISNVVSLQTFAQKCSMVKEIWLSRGAPGNVKDMLAKDASCNVANSFDGCENLQSIYASIGDGVNTFEKNMSWNIKVQNNNTFRGCVNLIGSSGSTFADQSDYNKSTCGSSIYAKLDGRLYSGNKKDPHTDNDGYFTRVSKCSAGDSQVPPVPTSWNRRYKEEMIDKVVKSYGNGDYEAGLNKMIELYDNQVIDSIVSASTPTVKLSAGNSAITDYTVNLTTTSSGSNTNEKWISHVEKSGQYKGTIYFERVYGDTPDPSTYYLSVQKSDNPDPYNYQINDPCWVQRGDSGNNYKPWSNSHFMPEKISGDSQTDLVISLRSYNECGLAVRINNATVETGKDINLGARDNAGLQNWKLNFKASGRAEVLKDGDDYTLRFYHVPTNFVSNDNPERVYYNIPATLSCKEDAPWAEYANRITKIEADPTFANWTGWYHTNACAHFFEGFTNLKYVTLPNEFKGLGDHAFANCTNLSKVVIGTSDNGSALNRIGAFCFDGCERLENYVLRKSGTSDTVAYDASAFDGAGTNNPEIAASFVKAGGNATTSKFSDAYTYTSIKAAPTSSKFLNKNYYYVDQSFNISSQLFVQESNEDCVLDLNGCTIDRQGTGGSSDRLILIGDDVNYVDIKFRIDDSNASGQGTLTGGNSGYNGGGIRVCGRCSTDFVRGNISGNTSTRGGGVSLSDLETRSTYSQTAQSPAIFNMYSGANITRNHATQTDAEGSGGGIGVRAGCTVNMYGGNISDNTSDGKYGAGVFVLNSNTNEKFANFFMYNGTIRNNKYNGVENNIYAGYDDIPKCKICVKDGGDTNFTITNHDINESRGYFTFAHDYTQDGKNNITINGFKMTDDAVADGKNSCTTAYVPKYNTKDNHVDSFMIGDGLDPIFTDYACQCIYIPAEVSKIENNAFKDSLLLKKIVVENTALTIGASAFEGCKNLENYVVRATSADTIDYGDNSFNEAGTGDVGVSHAPFVVAGASSGNTKTKFSGDNYYTYKELSDVTTTSLNTKKTYYYLTADKSSAPNILYDAADCVLDLNNHTINRSLNAKDQKGNVISMRGVSGMTNMALRVDNTADINTKASSRGKITGGYSMGGTDQPDNKFYAGGGGISVGSCDQGETAYTGPKTLNFVNGNIYNNKSIGAGGGIYVSRTSETTSTGTKTYGQRTLNIYGGVVANNDSQNDYNNIAGGGVCIYEGSLLNMYGGYIIGNVASSTTKDKEGGGGAFAINRSNANFYGGRIGGLTQGDDENNVAYYGGGIYLSAKNLEVTVHAEGNDMYAKNNIRRVGITDQVGGYWCWPRDDTGKWTWEWQANPQTAPKNENDSNCYVPEFRLDKAPVYDGIQKTVDDVNCWQYYDPALMTISNCTGINAGNYMATFALKDKSKYTWVDGTTEDKTVKWCINGPIVVVNAETNGDTTLNFKIGTDYDAQNVYGVPNSVSSKSDVPWQQYADKDKITKITFDENFATWPQWASATENTTRSWFEGFTGLKTVNIPNFVTRIGVDCFKGCTNLKKVVVGDTVNPSLASVGAAAFANCTSLENFVVRKQGEGVTDVINYAKSADGKDLVFTGAGSADPCVAAPLIFSSIDNGATKTLATNLKKSFYTYNDISSPQAKTTLTMSTGNYYYMSNNYLLSARAEVAPSADCVLDLAGHILDRGLSPESTDKRGQAIIVAPALENGPETTLRVDDSFSLNKDQTGKIINAHGNGALPGSSYKDSIGGGIYVGCYSGQETTRYSTLNFVNGHITQNSCYTEGAGIAVSNYCTLKVYGGYITNNTETPGSDDRYGGGGVSLRGNGMFIMYGGEITNNVAAYHGGGVSINGGGVTSKCKLYKGKILNNTTTIDGDKHRDCDVFHRSLVDSNTFNTEFVAFDDCQFTMENEGIEVYKIHEDGTATVNRSVKGANTFNEGAGHAVIDWQKYFVAHIPQQIVDAKGTAHDVKGIEKDAFKDNPYIKKVTIDLNQNLTEKFIVGADSFRNASHLENFVVKTTVDGNMEYEAGSFIGAGNRNDKQAGYQGAVESAPLGFAGGNVTKTAAWTKTVTGYQADDPVNLQPYRWTFKRVTDKTFDPETESGGLEQFYYYLDSDMTDGDRYVYTQNKKSLTVAKGIAVLDLNGHWLSRNLSTPEEWGATITMSSSTTLRLDDTSTVQRNVNSLGRVTGGKNTRAYGGGINMYGITGCRFIFANGAIYGNTSEEGGGMTVYDGNNAYMFGGLIYGNTANHVNTSGKYGQDILCGGGVSVRPSASFFVYGGAITGNTAYCNGGGVALWTGADGTKPPKLYIYGGIINSNTSCTANGGTKNTNSGYWVKYYNDGYYSITNKIGTTLAKPDGGYKK